MSNTTTTKFAVFMTANGAYCGSYLAEDCEAAARAHVAEIGDPNQIEGFNSHDVVGDASFYAYEVTPCQENAIEEWWRNGGDDPTGEWTPQWCWGDPTEEEIVQHGVHLEEIEYDIDPDINQDILIVTVRLQDCSFNIEYYRDADGETYCEADSLEEALPDRFDTGSIIAMIGEKFDVWSEMDRRRSAEIGSPR